MNKYFLSIALAIVLLFVFPSKISAQVVINEFSVSPSDNQDWIEIYSPVTFDISGWKVADETGIFFTAPAGTVLGPDIYYVISKYARLNNDKDSIYLYDSQDVQKDSIKYGHDGEVCLPSSGGSIARVPDGANIYDRLLVNTKGQSNGSSFTDTCPTPSPTPTQTPSPTPTPTPTPTTSAAVKTPTPTIKSIVTIKPTSTPSPTVLGDNSEGLLQTDITEGMPTSTPPSQTEVPEESEKKFPILPFVFIGLGLICLVAAFYPFLKSIRSRYNDMDEENN